MVLTIQLYPPLKFPDDKKLREIEVAKYTRLREVLEQLNSEGVFGSYGYGSMLLMTNDRIIDEDFVLEDEQTVKIMLNITGG